MNSVDWTAVILGIICLLFGVAMGMYIGLAIG